MAPTGLKIKWKSFCKRLASPEVQSLLAQEKPTGNNARFLAKLIDETVAQPLCNKGVDALDWKSTTRDAVECYALAPLMKLLHWFIRQRSLELYQSSWDNLRLCSFQLASSMLKTLQKDLVDVPDSIMLRDQCWQQLTEHPGMMDQYARMQMSSYYGILAATHCKDQCIVDHGYSNTCSLHMHVAAPICFSL